MNSIKIVAVVLGVLMVVFAGAFVYTYSEMNRNNGNTHKVNSNQVLGDAFSHWNDISIENSTLLSNQYANNASLQWIGGPLSGTYSGIGNITATWNKFFNLWGAVWFYTITPPTVTIYGQYATVTSQNQFVVTPANDPYQVQYINVSYKIVYSGSTNLIQNEVWKITGTGFISTNDQAVMVNQITSLAFSHWNNIAIEIITTVMPQYAANATLNWASGPLKGIYNGTASIQNTWNRFFGLWNAVWFYTEAPPTVAIHGNVATVNATVQFVVQSSSNLSKFMYINVTYGLKYMMTGFNIHTGNFDFEIVYENFDNTAIGPINKV